MTNSSRPIAFWLLSCAFLVACMVLIGGLTRLTESGLSITEWKPVSGVLPPITEQAWQEEFAKYQQSPEYQKKNLGMSMEEFKFIYAFEYGHRLLGRLAGFVFFLPFLYFLIRKKVTKTMGWLFLTIFVLGGAQGALGWYMVKSGLIHNPWVSPYRLSAHLSMAFLLFGLLFWHGCTIGKLGYKKLSQPISVPTHFTRALYGLVAISSVQIILGAFVAGLDAGMIYNTYPKMGENYIPNGLFHYSPLLSNFLENPITVQFSHRMIALVVALSVAGIWWWSKRYTWPLILRNSIDLLAIMMVVQFALGVGTLLAQVPVDLASMHQMGALVFIAIQLYILRQIYWLKHTNS